MVPLGSCSRQLLWRQVSRLERKNPPPSRSSILGEVVAIKKVLQDKRFKNRELQIMRQLEHPNIVQLKHCFYSNGEKPDELYLNLVLEYVPETVYGVARQYQKSKQALPIIYVKVVHLPVSLFFFFGSQMCCSYTYTNFVDHLHTFMHWAFAIGISSLRIYY